MLKSLVICAAVAILVVLTGSESQARPGGGGARGGGRPAGGSNFRGGGDSGRIQGNNPIERNPLQNDARGANNLNPGEVNARNRGEVLPGPDGLKPATRQALDNKANAARDANAAAMRAFTPAWYAQHPQAWQFNHPHADAWAVTSFATAATWLGWNAVQSGGTTTYNADSDTVTAPQSEASLPPAGAGPPAGSSDDWLPLGVYSVVKTGQTQGTSLIQLAINKEGAVSGTYYDELSDSSHMLQGSVNSQSQTVSWSVGESGNVTFQASLQALTQKSAAASVRLADGRTTECSLVKQSAPAQKQN